MDKEKAVIVGAGEAGQELYLELKKNFKERYEVFGFLDDDPKLVNKKIEGLKVLGPIEALSKTIRKNKITEVFIAIPSAQGSLIRKVIKNCEKERVVFKIVPRLLEIVEGRVKLAKVREIEVEDLLGRALIQSDQKVFQKEFKDKVVLVTGAAGSIGSEICRQIVNFKPKKLVALDMWESGLYELDLELKEATDRGNFECVVADVRELPKLRNIFSKFKPDYVFHAAAYKHVPLMQEHPEEAVKNNVFGTKNVCEAAKESSVARVINISTDKAVNPTSVMGTTKLLGECIASENGFTSVRFGNVLGSQGSVVPTFKKQIAKGGPVTVTDKNMTRFFMSIPEAVQLVLTAALTNRGQGEVFMLDMGEPVRIDELARLMIRLSGYVPDVDIEVKYTGVRPGEKMEEELRGAKANLEETANPKVFIVKEEMPQINLREILIKLKEASKSQNRVKIIEILKKVAPNLK